MRVALVSAVLAFLGGACAPLDRSGVEFEGLACGQKDQYRSYMNPIDSTRVQTISVDNRFSPNQIQRIKQAVAKWNAQSQGVLGRTLFRVQEFPLAVNSIPSQSSDCGFPGTPGGFSIVSVSSDETWTALGFTENNPGVTIRCAAGKDFVAKQVILMNTSKDKREGAQALHHDAKELDVFENVVLHEVGHAIGLHHSCDSMNRGDESFRGCGELNAWSDPYREAVMYYMVYPDYPKTELTSNDEERATCALNYRP